MAGADDLKPLQRIQPTLQPETMPAATHPTHSERAAHGFAELDAVEQVLALAWNDGLDRSLHPARAPPKPEQPR